MLDLYKILIFLHKIAIFKGYYPTMKWPCFIDIYEDNMAIPCPNEFVQADMWR